MVSLRKSSFDTSEDIALKVSTEGFKVVHVGTQDDKSTIWYETVDPPITTMMVYFKRVRSGEVVPERGYHVGVSRVDYGSHGGEIFYHIYQIYK